MKKILAIAAFTAVMSGCVSTQVTTGTDDVYANPAEEKRLAQIARQQQAEQQARERKAMEEKAAEERSKEASNQYYKDPEYKADDYYDYEYASRINRFSRPLYGAGYYDPYYTNLYTYNQNPAFYGTSIYSSSMMMPSSQFNNWSFGISSGWGYNPYSYGYGGYNPWYGMYGYDPWGYPSWGYNSWMYNPWGYNSGFYSGYNMGYYNGWNNSQWGYLNKLDPNSGYNKMEYGPRGSGAGGNSSTRTSPGMEALPDEGRQKYFQNVTEEQSRTPRFSTYEDRNNGTRISNRSQRPAYENNNGQPSQPSRIEDGRQAEPANGSQNTRIRRDNRIEERPEQNQQRPIENRNQGIRQGGMIPGNSPVPRNSGGGGNSPRR